MSDQQPPQNGDTAAVAGPDGAPGTAEGQPQETDWQKRYSDLQPEYTRTTQRLSELETAQQWYEVALTSEDPDTRRQALEALGYPVEDDVDDQEPVEYDDPYDQLAQRQQALEERYEQDRTQAAETQEAALIRELTDARLGELVPDLPEEDQNMILAYAIHALPFVQAPPGSPVRGLPDVDQAAEIFKARETERQKTWANTKRAPYVPSGGRPANEVPDPGTGHNARMNRAMRELHEADQ